MENGPLNCLCTNSWISGVPAHIAHKSLLLSISENVTVSKPIRIQILNFQIFYIVNHQPHAESLCL